MRVYLDLAVLLNTAVDFFLLMGTNAMAGFPGSWRRNLPAAALGGLYGGACLVPGLAFLGSVVWRMVFLGLMAWAAFGWNRGSLRRIGVFALLSMSLGGIAVAFGKGWVLSASVGAAAVWMLCRLLFGTGAGQQYVPVTLRHGGREVRVLALKDTGNSLRDPVTGAPVLILGKEPAGRLTGLTEPQIASPVETVALGILPGLRLIPYRAVGRGGMLLGMKVDSVMTEGRETEMIVAFDPGDLGKETMYQALTGGV